MKCLGQRRELIRREHKENFSSDKNTLYLVCVAAIQYKQLSKSTELTQLCILLCVNYNSINIALCVYMQW